MGAPLARGPAPAAVALLDDVDADIAAADGALQALMGLLQGCDPAHPLLAGCLRSLLQPIATAVQQASETLATAQR